MCRAFGNKVLIEPVNELVSAAGIISPELGLSSTAPTKGTVVSVGEFCTDLTEGDLVTFPRGKGLDFINPDDDKKLLIMCENDVLAILKAQ